MPRWTRRRAPRRNGTGGGALVLTALLVHAGLAAWWLLPLVVIGILGASLWGMARTA